MKKVIRDGKVAVLYSPGYGAGWYTWNKDYPECVFDSELVVLVEQHEFSKVIELAEQKYGEGFYSGGAEDLQIEWLQEGTPFTIEEYDGSESIRTDDDLKLIA
jgi:hypothetical protein